MTGIIVCDNCHVLFFAHGTRNSLPKNLQEIRLFYGIRQIRSESQTNTTVSKFIDLCEECSKK